MCAFIELTGKGRRRIEDARGRNIKNKGGSKAKTTCIVRPLLCLSDLKKPIPNGEKKNEVQSPADRSRFVRGPIHRKA